jgi:hypothetical protein
MKTFQIPDNLDYNPHHFSGGFTYQELTTGMILTEIATSFDKKSFTEAINEIIRDPETLLVSYGIEGVVVEVAEPSGSSGGDD